jgi:putative nucleotidyltransferase with HDIG domain
MVTEPQTFHDRLLAVVAAGTDLPSISSSMLEIRRLVDDEDVDERKLVDALERDIAIVGRLLKAANAASVSLGGDRVASVSKAVRRLGLRRVRAISLAVSLLEELGRRPRALKIDGFWGHSAAVGAVSRALAVRLFPGQLDADAIYTAGLLHDVGLLILDQHFSADFDRVAALRGQVAGPWWASERLVLDATHGEIGALLLEQWGLPAMVSQAAAFHHEPERAPPEGRMGALVVRAAEYVCATELLALPQEALPPDLCADGLMAIGVPEEEAEDLMMELQDIAINDMGMLL